MNQKKLFLITLVICIIFIHYKKHYFFKTYLTSNFTTNLTKTETFELEKSCLQKIKKEYNCICKQKKNHFPKYICSIKNNFCYGILMTNIGTSLDKIKNIKKYKIPNIEEQINCIAFNLDKMKIYHCDILRKNITISKKGEIGLIDFNIAVYSNFKIPSRATNRIKKCYSSKEIVVNQLKSFFM